MNVVTRNFTALSATSPPPIKMAKKVHSVILTEHPTIHYRVGAFMQRISVALKHILPDKLFEKMLLNHYKL